jgi:hypothetical protein
VVLKYTFTTGSDAVYAERLRLGPFENEAAPVEPKTSPRMRSLQGLACLKLRPSRHIEKRSSGEARLELDSSTTDT